MKGPDEKEGGDRVGGGGGVEADHDTGKAALAPETGYRMASSSSFMSSIMPSSASVDSGKQWNPFKNRFGRRTLPPGMKEHVVRIPPNDERIVVEAPVGITGKDFIALVNSIKPMREAPLILVSKHLGTIVQDHMSIDAVDNKWYIREAPSVSVAPSPSLSVPTDWQSNNISDTSSMSPPPSPTLSTASSMPASSIAVQDSANSSLDNSGPLLPPPIFPSPALVPQTANPAVVASPVVATSARATNATSTTRRAVGLASDVGKRAIEKEFIFIEMSEPRQVVAFVANDTLVLRAVLSPNILLNSAALSAAAAASVAWGAQVSTTSSAAAALAAATGDFSAAVVAEFADVPRQFVRCDETRNVELYDIAIAGHQDRYFKMRYSNGEHIFKAMSYADKRDWFNRIHYFSRLRGVPTAADELPAVTPTDASTRDRIMVSQSEDRDSLYQPSFVGRGMDALESDSMDSDEQLQHSGERRFRRNTVQSDLRGGSTLRGRGRESRAAAMLAKTKAAEAYKADVETLKADMSTKAQMMATLSSDLYRLDVSTEVRN